jgi:hypothetical protein
VNGVYAQETKRENERALVPPMKRTEKAAEKTDGAGDKACNIEEKWNKKHAPIFNSYNGRRDVKVRANKVVDTDCAQQAEYDGSCYGKSVSKPYVHSDVA